MYNTDNVIIHTGLYGKTASKTIRLLYEGLREFVSYHDRQVEKNVLKIGRHYTGKSTKVEVDVTSEVTLKISPDYIGPTLSRWNKDDCMLSAYAKGVDTAYIKNWLAEDLRMRVKGLANSDTFQLHPASKTSQTSRVWEALATADALTGMTANDLDTKYGKDTGAKVIGLAIDPVKIEVNSVIHDEAVRIKREFKAKQFEMHREMERKIELLRIQYRKDVAELGKQERAAVTAMKKEMLAA